MSTVIKAGEAGTLIKRLATVDLADHLAEAHAVVEAARSQAKRIVEKAREAFEEVHEEARRSGYETGRVEGYKVGRDSGFESAHKEAAERFDDQHSAIVSDMNRAIREFDRMKSELRLSAERDLLDFAIALASKLAFKLGELHRESAVANLKRAIRLVGRNTDLTVRVHPDDVESMNTFAESILDRAEQADTIRVLTDASVAPGGCTVETERTRIDATLETQVGEIVSLLTCGRGDDG